VKPIISVKKILVTLELAPDLPDYAIGDDKRLMQTTLNVVGNAVKFTKEGKVSVRVSMERREYVQDPRFPDFHLVQTNGCFFLRVEVRKLMISVIKSV
jgi:ethylene receptor